MSLVTPVEVKRLVPTTLPDVEVQSVIEAEEAEVIRHFGVHYVDALTTVSETVLGETMNLFLQRRFLSVSTVTEDGTVLTVNDYEVWADQGRLIRLPLGSHWGRRVVVVYVPENDNAARKTVVIDLVRLTLERTAMKQERLSGGEYGYTAPENWDEERRRVLRRLGFLGVG